MLTHALASARSPAGTIPYLARTENHQPRDLDGHLAAAPIRTIEERELLFSEHDRRTHMYRVESGAVAVYKIMPDGRRQIVGFAYPGDLIGLEAHDTYRFNAQAMRPTRVRCVRWATLQHIARQDPEFGLKLYDAVSLELAAAHDLLLATGRRSATERVTTFLLAMSRRNERCDRDPLVLDLPMTRSDIGDFLGLTIETVSRTFTKLRRQKVIDLAQITRVHLRDLDQLEQLAEGAP